ncbi:MAG TPA: CPBP family intramembrane glutamic endopeptidase [Acidobacteriaceae bacterium]
MSSATSPVLAAEADTKDFKTSSPYAIGPLWMAAGVCLLFAAYAALGTIGHMSGAVPDYSQHLITYSSQVLGTWLLLGATMATVYHRRSFLRESLLDGARPWRIEFARGFAVFALFLIVATVVRALLLLACRKVTTLHHFPYLLQSTDHRLGVGHRVLSSLTPASGADLVLWMFVSVSAAVCEELIFRGYLLRQCIAALRTISVAPRTSIILSVCLTALLFGGMHLYQGVGSALTIAFLGATYAVAAVQFGNLRAVIIAHCVQDVVVGLYSYAHNFFLGS